MTETIQSKARTIRYHAVDMIGRAGSGHPGSSLSCADILAVLYFGEVLRVRPHQPQWPCRDRLVLSKGHAAPALYAALAERGFFSTEVLPTLRQLGSILQGHPDCRKVPGVEVSTGSLGQGLSLAVGMALAGQLDKASYNVWAILGDGECQEGQVWEAAMAANHYKLKNLAATIVDHNRLQIDGPVEEVVSTGSIAAKFEAFGWNTVVVDGHNVPDLVRLFQNISRNREGPVVVVAETVKGKGVSFMEGAVGWHGKAPKGEDLEKALRELDQQSGGGAS